jgi:citrate synthase
LWRAGRGLPVETSAGGRGDELSAGRRGDGLRAGRRGDGLSAATTGSHAGHYLGLVRNGAAAAAEVRALERYLIATIDHGFNASTFTARVVASTGADAAACLVAALGALSGPLHGGAPSRALELVEEVTGAGGPEQAASVVAQHLERGDKLMGFGHAVYRGDDPRSELLRRTARELGGPRVAETEAVEAALVAALDHLKPGRTIRPNVELYAGVVMERCGLPPELFTPTFAVSRVVGWGAHVLEQTAEGRLIRPSAHYSGPWPLEAVPGRPLRAA